MAPLTIAQLGEPVLQQVAEPISDPRDPAVTLLWQRMLITMNDANGVGIAAPQVFESKRLMIIASRPNPRYPDAPLMTPQVLINPEILATSRETSIELEGCLSVPSIRGRVKRPVKAHIRYTDVEGQLIDQWLSGFPARVFLHEFDHLEGKTFLDHIDSSADLIANSVLEKQLNQS